jgi:hypothetical protein
MLLVAASCQSSWKWDSGSSGAPSSATHAETVTLDQIVRTCALDLSCFDSPPITGDCVRTFEAGLLGGDWFVSPAEMRHFVECGGAAQGCDAALRCASFDHDPAYCHANPGVTCDGNIAVGCSSDYGGWPILSTDCASLDMQCAGNTCVRAQRSCSPDGSFCGGSWALRCEKGQDTSFDCQLLGAQFTCTDPGDNATCIATAPICTDCAGPDGSECSGSEQQCVGTSLRICANGNWRDFDCKKFGFSNCAPSGSSAKCVI